MQRPRLVLAKKKVKTNPPFENKALFFKKSNSSLEPNTSTTGKRRPSPSLIQVNLGVDQSLEEQEHDKKDIRLNMKQLKEIPMSMKRFQQLIHLALENNAINGIQKDMIPETLESLSLKNNRIKEISNEALLNLKKLKVLNLNFNPLARLPDGIVQLSNLNFLGILGTDMTHIPRVISQIPSLTEVQHEWAVCIDPNLVMKLSENNDQSFLKDSFLDLKVIRAFFYNKTLVALSFIEYMVLEGRSLDLILQNGLQILLFSIRNNLKGFLKYVFDIDLFHLKAEVSKIIQVIIFSMDLSRIEILKILDQFIKTNNPSVFGNNQNMFTLAFHHSKADHLILSKMIEAGFDPDSEDFEGNTCLHFIFKNYSEYKFNFNKSGDALLEHGADPNKKNKKGMTPLMLALYFKEKRALTDSIEWNKKARQNKPSIDQLQRACSFSIPFDLKLENTMTGETLLHYACKIPSLLSIISLIEEGSVDPLGLNNDLKTARQLLPISHSMSNKILLMAERKKFKQILEDNDDIFSESNLESTYRTASTERKSKFLIPIRKDSNKNSRPSSLNSSTLISSSKIGSNFTKKNTILGNLTEKSSSFILKIPKKSSILLKKTPDQYSENTNLNVFSVEKCLSNLSLSISKDSQTKETTMSIAYKQLLGLKMLVSQYLYRKKDLFQQENCSSSEDRIMVEWLDLLLNYLIGLSDNKTIEYFPLYSHLLVLCFGLMDKISLVPSIVKIKIEGLLYLAISKKIDNKFILWELLGIACFGHAFKPLKKTIVRQGIINPTSTSEWSRPMIGLSKRKEYTKELTAKPRHFY